MYIRVIGILSPMRDLELVRDLGLYNEGLGLYNEEFRLYNCGLQ
jgi:hypothetical protein